MLVFWDLFGLTAFWNLKQKLALIIWVLTLIPKMYFFLSGNFSIKSYYRSPTPHRVIETNPTNQSPIQDA